MSLDEQWEQADRIGTIAGGRYRIAAEVASDARRTLYEAEDVEHGLRVMLAVVPAAATPIGERLRSCEKLRALDHPVLVRVLAVGTLDGGEPFVVTERPVGTPLRAVIAAKPLDQRRAVAIVRRVAEALAALHAAGAVHGDIKPESIFLWMDGTAERVTLIDAGVGALAGPSTADARYAAPECDAGEIDARADLYALGAVLFELLTGHAPFFADDISSARRLHAYAPVQTLAQRAPDRTFNHALEEIVAMALTKKREARLQTANDMIAVLDHALQSIEELAPTPPAARRGDDGNNSLLLIARDLMPAAARPSVDLPLLPANVGRHVPELPWTTRAVRPLRRAFDRATRRTRRIALGLAIALPVAIVLVLALTCHGHPAQAPVIDVAADQIARGHALLAAGDERGALDAYLHAIRARPATATHAEVLAALGQIADSHDPTIAVAALEMIGSWSGPDGYDAIARRASSSPMPEVRHRAWSLADQAGIMDQVDRVASWILDLDQATSCEQRRAAIDKLAHESDPRALPALRKARAHGCVEKGPKAP